MVWNREMERREDRSAAAVLVVVVVMSCSVARAGSCGRASSSMLQSALPPADRPGGSVVLYSIPPRPCVGAIVRA